MTFHEMHETMPYYSQKTGPYADLPYHGHTVSTDGCGPVAFAMAASYLLGDEITPDQVIEWAGRRFAGFLGRGTKTSFFPAAAKAYGLTCRPTNEIGEVCRALRKGCPVIFYTGGSKGLFSVVDHYLTLAGIDEEGRIAIHNPNERSDGQFFTPDVIDRYRKRRPLKYSYHILGRSNSAE